MSRPLAKDLSIDDALLKADLDIGYGHRTLPFSTVPDHFTRTDIDNQVKIMCSLFFLLLVFGHKFLFR